MEQLDLDVRNYELIDENFSSITAKEKEDLCERAYERALKEHKTADNPFPVQASNALADCQKNPKKYQKLEKGGSKFDWNKAFGVVNQIGQSVKDYGATSTGANIGEQWQGNTPPPSTRDTDVRILGMKPLVFTVVALGVVIAGGIGIAMLGKKAGKAK